MRKAVAIVVVVVSIGWFVTWWRRHPRFGAGTVNRIVNPWLVRQGIAEVTRGEIGLLEHVGRKSGTVRVTPVHPVRTIAGFRIIVPLGGESQWARNVLAAGHCRLQTGDAVHELDEPRLVAPTAVEDLPGPAARVMEWLGFRYILMRDFAERPGSPGRASVDADAEAATFEPKPVPTA